MQVSATATTSNIDTVTLEIPKSQFSMMSERGANLVHKGRNSYLINSLMLSGHTSLGHGMYKPTINEDTNTHYLLQLSLALS